MKWKLFARRMSISAPRMTVKRHWPWPVRVGLWCCAIVVAGFCAISIWQATVGAGVQARERLEVEAGDLRRRLAEQTRIRQDLAAQVQSADSRVQIEKSTAERLTLQVRTLEQENAKLKSDLAYMEGLLPSSNAAAGAAAGVSLRQFEVRADSLPGQYRYRALVFLGGREQREFSGSTQLVVMGAGGKSSTLTFPSEGDKLMSERMQLKFKRTMRIEGNFQVPVDFNPKAVVLRIVEQGAVKAQSQVAL
jgi:hypothetical protein